MLYAVIAVVCFIAGGVVDHLYEGRVLKAIAGLEDKIKALVDKKL